MPVATAAAVELGDLRRVDDRDLVVVKLDPAVGALLGPADVVPAVGVHALVRHNAHEVVEAVLVCERVCISRSISISMMACSATAPALQPLLLHTQIPRSRAAERSILSKATPSEWISFKFGIFPIREAVTGVMASTNRMPASAAAARMVSSLLLLSKYTSSCCRIKGRRGRYVS